jgi:hypothetical protein
VLRQSSKTLKRKGRGAFTSPVRGREPANNESEMRPVPRKPFATKLFRNFKLKINISTVHDSYEAWREGDYDDLVLSVALVCWVGERFLEKLDTISRPGVVVQDAPMMMFNPLS